MAAPIDVFERMLWESTVESESKVASEAVAINKSSRLSYGDKIDPDIPRKVSQKSEVLEEVRRLFSHRCQVR